MSRTWIIVTEEKPVAALAAAARALGKTVAAVVVGPRALADAAALAGPDEVTWIDAGQDRGVEAFAAPVAGLIAGDAPKAVLAGASPESRVLAGRVAATMSASLVPGVLSLSMAEDRIVMDRSGLDGRVIETLEAAGPVVAIYAGDDIPAATERSGAGAAVTPLVAEGVADIVIEKTEPAAGADAGITKAQVVVSVGRGLRKKEDLSIIRDLASAVGGEIGCSMPVADDLGWVEKDRYVGRSGQHIAPRLYIAVGIQGAPQHLEGIRGARIVVGINNDPEAPIFKASDYGIVGDLYEVVPALLTALCN
ncbi:MAG: electron transfer flavoprotein subunit alpha/FixB family protein [Telmatospirillum sp.]|nr:electron transfer flavoprotein subunit alpha/FixB family protein [Telmatospirillum sp.]